MCVVPSAGVEGFVLTKCIYVCSLYILCNICRVCVCCHTCVLLCPLFRYICTLCARIKVIQQMDHYAFTANLHSIKFVDDDTFSTLHLHGENIYNIRLYLVFIIFLLFYNLTNKILLQKGYIFIEIVNNILNSMKTRSVYPSVRTTTVSTQYSDETNLHI